MEYFRNEKGRLVIQRQYEASLNRLSPLRRLLNKINYDSNMEYAKSKIWHALKREQPVFYLEYPNATEEEIKDIVARLEYLGYNVDFTHIFSYIIQHPSKIIVIVRLDDNTKGIDYVSY